MTDGQVLDRGDGRGGFAGLSGTADEEHAIAVGAVDGDIVVAADFGKQEAKPDAPLGERPEVAPRLFLFRVRRGRGLAAAP